MWTEIHHVAGSIKFEFNQTDVASGRTEEYANCYETITNAGFLQGQLAKAIAEALEYQQNSAARALLKAKAELELAQQRVDELSSKVKELEQPVD